MNFVLDGPDCLQVVVFLGALHAFGSEDAVDDILPEELGDEYAGDGIVDGLFVVGVDVEVLGAKSVEFSKGVLVDIVVHLAPDQLLEEIVSFDSYATWVGTIIPFQQKVH